MNTDKHGGSMTTIQPEVRYRTSNPIANALLAVLIDAGGNVLDAPAMRTGVHRLVGNVGIKELREARNLLYSLGLAEITESRPNSATDGPGRPRVYMRASWMALCEVKQ